MVAEERALSLLAAALTAALATTLVAALPTAALVAAGGRGVLLHLATAGRRSVLLHLAAIFDFFAAFRSRWRKGRLKSRPFFVEHDMPHKPVRATIGPKDVAAYSHRPAHVRSEEHTSE